jgi:hypothetical protein
LQALSPMWLAPRPPFRRGRLYSCRQSAFDAAGVPRCSECGGRGEPSRGRTATRSIRLQLLLLMSPASSVAHPHRQYIIPTFTSVKDGFRQTSWRGWTTPAGREEKLLDVSGFTRRFFFSRSSIVARRSPLRDRQRRFPPCAGHRREAYAKPPARI